MTKILIIEDEEALLDMYRLRFQKDGYTVVGATKGEEGIKLAKKEKPDLILLDVIMPGLDGYEVLRRLKADPETKNLRVIFLSNLGQSGEVQDGLAMGAEEYIIKSSLTPSSLVERVRVKLGPDAKVKAPKPTKREMNHAMGQPSCVDTKVLLIEDNEAIISMYKLRLEKEGAKVTVAKNGAWGLKQAGSGEFDIILMDIVMPALNGVEAIKGLKNDPKTANIPVLVFSNSAQDQDILDAKAAGAENYLVKSNITPATLIWEIKKYCKR